MEIKDIINSFAKKKILLFGDAILDIYSHGNVVCQSSDSCAPEVEEKKNEIFFGGACLVASNILELGGQVVFFSVIGNDEAAKHYDNFCHPKLEKHFLIDKTRPTTIKKRFWFNGEKLFQANMVDNRYLDPELATALLEEAEPFFNQIDSIVILDAQHGLLSKELIAGLIKLSQEYQKPLYVDSQISHRPSNHYFYQGADCFFLNQNEAEAIDLNSLSANYIVKLGKDGCESNFGEKRLKIPSYQVETIDPCGAGDAFLAAFSLGERDFPEESLTIANTWAALSTAILGTRPPQKKELIKIYE